MNLNLNIDNQTDYKLPDSTVIESYILNVLKEKGIEGEIEVSLSLVDKNEIHRFNKEYRHKDYPTDVLSFPIFDRVPQENPTPTLIGDIIISPEVMLENAEKYGVSPEKELENLIAHSTLHLLGYHHKGDE